MSDLRRRAVKEIPRDENNNDDTKHSSTADTETKTKSKRTHNIHDDDGDKKQTLSPIVRFKRYITKPRGKRRNSFVFLLGGLFGIFIALFFANQNEVISLDALMDLNLDSLIDVIPTGILRDAREITVRICLLKLERKSC
jgi:phospholipid:diacylglycerol acyltransferase